MFSSLRDERGTILVFFYPHGSCVLSDLDGCPGHLPDHKQMASNSAAKIMRQPNPRPSDDAHTVTPQFLARLQKMNGKEDDYKR